MKLYSAIFITSGECAIHVNKNNGKYITSIPAHVFASALKDKSKQIVIEYKDKRYGFTRQDVVNFLLQNAVNDLYSDKDFFNILREGV